MKRNTGLMSRTAVLIAITALFAAMALMTHAYVPYDSLVDDDDAILDTVMEMMFSRSDEYDIQSESLSGQTLCVTASSLNVRWCASTTCRVVGSVRSGDRVTIRETHGAWRNIGLGWVHSDYLKSCGGGGGGSGGNTGGGRKCTTAALNVRSGRSTSSRIIRTLPQGTAVNVQSISGDWAQIGNGQFVHKGYLGACGSTGGGGGGGGSGSISQAQLQRIIPQLASSRASQLMPHLNRALKEANINTCRRISAFIAQLAHESGGLQWFEEFASGDAYEGRRDLCNTVRGDGRRFKGRGPIQLTGRCNYTAAGKALGLDLVGNPTQVATFSVGFRTSAWYWNSRSLNQYADQHTQASFDTITRRINGGLNGKADRDKYWRQAKAVLGC